MKKYREIISLLFLSIFFIVTSAYCAKINGWVKNHACGVFEKPNANSRIIGIIKYGAFLCGEDMENGWVKTTDAPVRNLIEGYKGMVKGKLYVCRGCYIQKSDVSMVLPRKW